MAEEPQLMLRVYSVYDRKLKEFSGLMLSRNDEALRRQVYDGVVGSGSMVEKHPEDFDLYRVGEFWPETGFVGGLTSKAVLVFNVSELLTAARSEPRLRAEA